MKIIDAHLHFSKIESFSRTAKELSLVSYTPEGLYKEFAENEISAGIAMGVTEEALGGFPDASSRNPMGLDLEENKPSVLFECTGINPVRLDSAERQSELDRLEKHLAKSGVVGIKIYAGYYPYYVYDRVYEPVYELAVKYNLPVVIHCGDTFSDRGRLKYSHPLTVDEVAVQYRDINFILSHLGDPWVMDTAELALKNPNVYADLSGLIVGDANKIKSYADKQLLVDNFRRALLYTDNYGKFLFGSDWPLVPIGPYIDFIKGLVPEEYHEAVFYNNALQVFKKLKEMLDVLPHSSTGLLRPE